jgi:hypothetical protein
VRAAALATAVTADRAWEKSHALTPSRCARGKTSERRGRALEAAATFLNNGSEPSGDSPLSHRIPFSPWALDRDELVGDWLKMTQKT